ncbi:MAG: hypothetical protein ACRDQU_08425 [Pseudonocardiaceae bacterium]
MSDAMSFAELAQQHVELLPARTVLSLCRADIDGLPGAGGDPGTPGGKGQSYFGTNMWALITGYNQSDPSSNAGVTGSKNG